MPSRRETAALQKPREASVWLEGNTPRFGVLRVRHWDADLVCVPQDVPVLNLQHLAESAAGFERPDDPIPHLRAGEHVFDAIELVRGLEEFPFFIGADPTVALRLDLRLDLHTEPVEWRRGENRRRAAAPPVDGVSQYSEHAIDRGD